MNTQILDPIPIWVVFVGFAIVSLLLYEVGFRVGRWWQDREPGEQEGPTDVLVGALLALMAFLLAVTTTMASDRFDTRRGMVLVEANAIGQAYLQSDYLPEPSAEAMKELLREYLPLRITPDDKSQLPAYFAARPDVRRGDVGPLRGGRQDRPQPGPHVLAGWLADRHRQRRPNPYHGGPLCPRPRDRPVGPAHRLGARDRDGRLQRRRQGPPQRPQRCRAGARPGDRDRARHGPRPAAGRARQRGHGAAAGRAALDRATREAADPASSSSSTARSCWNASTASVTEA